MTLLILPLDIKIFSYLCSCPKKSEKKKKKPEKENSVFWVYYLVFKET